MIKLYTVTWYNTYRLQATYQASGVAFETNSLYCADKGLSKQVTESRMKPTKWGKGL